MTLAIAVDEDGCPTDPAMRTALKALAQRGARLVMSGAGAAVEAERRGATVAISWLAADAVAALVSQGFLTAIDADTLILAPAGRTSVRRMKAAPAPADGIAAAASGRDPSPEGPPALAPGRAHAPATSLAWLRARRDKQGRPLLSAHAFEAGERLRADFHRAGMRPRITVDWAAVPKSRDERRGAVASARDVSDCAAAAAERVRRALAAVPAALAGLTMDICCLDLGFEHAERRHDVPKRAVHWGLKIALDELARHYGMIPRTAGSWSTPSRARHWGADDFRPTL